MNIHLSTKLLPAFITFLLFVIILSPAAVSQQKPTITIAVVKDGPGRYQDILTEMKSELAHLVGDRGTVLFDEKPAYDAQWNPDRMRTVIESAMKNPDVDYVVGFGYLIAQAALRPDLKLDKPMIIATVMNGDVPKVEYIPDSKPLKKNLSLLLFPTEADPDVTILSSIRPIKKLHFALNDVDAGNLVDLGKLLRSSSQKYGIEISVLPVRSDIGNVLSMVDASVEAVLFLQTPRLTYAQRMELADSLTARGILTFSGMGRSDVEAGMLATAKPDMTREIARRTALNLQQLYEGSSTQELPVYLLPDSEFIINGKTARVLGYVPSYDVRVSATFIHGSPVEEGKQSLTLGSAMAMAEKGNSELMIVTARTETFLSEKNIARSPMLPQIGLNGNFDYFDNNLVGDLIPDQFASVGVGLSQMLYDDEIISGFRSSSRQYDAAELRRESARLDILLAASQSYLRLVRAGLLYKIDMDNLRITEDNLKLARMRVNVGNSGRDEVFRWEAETATRRSRALVTEARMEANRIDLNQVLGVKQDARWQTEEIAVGSDELYFMNGALDYVLKSAHDFERFRNASVTLALEYSPEAKGIRKKMEAQEILLGQSERSYYLPKLSTNLGYNYIFYQSPDVPQLGQDNMHIGVTASLPLFEGTRRIHQVERNQAVLNELSATLLLTNQLIEQQTRTALRSVEAAAANIKYSAIAASSSKKNFEVVQEKYANGIVSITDLLEAQNTSFAAQQSAASAVYNVLLKIAEYQRAVSFFSEEKSDEERNVYMSRLNVEMNK